MLHNEQFQYFPYAYNGRGHVTSLTSDDMHEKSEINEMRVPEGLLLLLSEIFMFLRKIACHWQRCKFTALCYRAEVYSWRHRPVTWPDLKMKRFIMSGLNRGQSCEISALFRRTALELSRENRLGGTTPLSQRGLTEFPFGEGVKRYSQDFGRSRT